MVCVPPIKLWNCTCTQFKNEIVSGTTTTTSLPPTTAQQTTTRAQQTTTTVAGNNAPVVNKGDIYISTNVIIYITI